MFRLNFFYSFLFFFIFGACKTTQPVRPMEHYNTEEREKSFSTINIPIKIDKNALQKSINIQLGDVLYEDSTMQDDDLMIKAIKHEDIEIEIFQDEIKYSVPLDLWIKYGLTLFDVEAEGKIALNFTTKYRIQENWHLETLTEIEDYDWIQRPVIKTGIVNLPIKFIANIVLDKTKAMITEAIDEQVKNSLDLAAQMEDVWKQMKFPQLISEEYKTWIMMNPERISMTPLKIDADTIETTIIITSEPEIHIGDQPRMKMGKPLPNFVYTNFREDHFSMTLGTQISFKEAERLSKENMVGETYTFGRRSVTIEDMELWGQGNKLVINTKLSGSYQGNIYFIGKPKYNARKNKIELTNVEFDFSTQRVLLKSASWIFKGQLKKKVQENLDFYLDYNMEEMKKMVQAEMNGYEITEGVKMFAELSELNVSNVYLSTEAINVKVDLKGKLRVEMNNFLTEEVEKE